jgi:hypothetical protein
MSKEADSSESQVKPWQGWIFELVKLAVPSLITIIFGYYIYVVQTDIKAKVDTNQETLRSQLAFQSALKEEFYKRRLSVYENACRELANAQAALNNAGNTTEAETQAFDIIAKFDQLNKGNSLYWSHDLQDGLDAFWTLGVDKLRFKKWDDAEANEKISKGIAALHQQMKTDLNVLGEEREHKQ